jgi:hypothetical protein
MSGGLMKLFGKLALAGAIAALALPAAAPAKVFHFKGKATGPKAAPNMVVSFDVTGSKGRASRISNIYVEKAEYNCQLGIKTTERNFRMFSSGTIKRNGKFDVREKQLPPGSDNWFYGQVIYSKTLKTKSGPSSPSRAGPRRSSASASRVASTTASPRTSSRRRRASAGVCPRRRRGSGRRPRSP